VTTAPAIKTAHLSELDDDVFKSTVLGIVETGLFTG